MFENNCGLEKSKFWNGRDRTSKCYVEMLRACSSLSVWRAGWVGRCSFHPSHAPPARRARRRASRSGPAAPLRARWRPGTTRARAGKRRSRSQTWDRSMQSRNGNVRCTAFATMHQGRSRRYRIRYLKGNTTNSSNLPTTNSSNLPACFET